MLGPQAPSNVDSLHFEGVGEMQACLACSSAWPVEACQDYKKVVLGTRHLNGARGWRRTEGEAALEPGDWGRGQGPRCGLGGQALGVTLPECLCWPGQGVDLLCVGVSLWSGYGSAFGGMQWVLDGSPAVGALFVMWPTFWEETRSKTEEGKAGKLALNSFLSHPEPHALQPHQFFSSNRP